MTSEERAREVALECAEREALAAVARVRVLDLPNGLRHSGRGVVLDRVVAAAWAEADRLVGAWVALLEAT